MPKDTKAPNALKRLEEAQAKQSMMYGIQRLGLDTEGRQTILRMDPFNKLRPTRPMSDAAFEKQTKDVQKQIALLQRQAEIARQKRDAAAEKKVMDELSDLMAAAPLGSDLGPPRYPSFRSDYERITNIPYEETIGRARKSRKGKKGGKKTRKASKTRRH